MMVKAREAIAGQEYLIMDQRGRVHRCERLGRGRRQWIDHVFFRDVRGSRPMVFARHEDQRIRIATPRQEAF